MKNLLHHYIGVITTILVVAGVAFVERLYIGESVYLTVKNNSSGPLGELIFSHGKTLSRVATLSFVIYALLATRSASATVASVINAISPMRLLLLPLQVATTFTLLKLTTGAFSGSGDHILAWQLAWCLCLLGYIASTLLCILPLSRFVLLVKRTWLQACIAITLSISIWNFSLFTQSLWDGLSDSTFSAVIYVLRMAGLDAVAEPGARIIGLDSFFVSVDTACSGYEGIGLILAFTSIYLFSFRDQFRFPIALLILPMGAICMWAFNIVRIAVLVVIGAFWSPDVAVKGFHTQGGWITFILISLMIMFFSHRVAFFRKSVNSHQNPAPPLTLSEPASSASLIPLIALLASTILTNAFTSDFNWLYFLRVIAVMLAIFFIWSTLELKKYHACQSTLIAILVGIAVAIFWIYWLPYRAEDNAIFERELWKHGPYVAAAWLTCRFIGTAITVPIAEELGFRGYLLCRLQKMTVTLTGRIPLSLFAIAASSIAFAALHSQWVAGLIAGASYALVRCFSRHICDVIIAHGVTNALIFVYALHSGNWYLI